MSDNYKVSGDPFWKNSFGVAPSPIATLIVQETKAPEEHYINNEVFVRQITSNISAENVNTYNEPKIPEQVMKFKLYNYLYFE